MTHSSHDKSETIQPFPNNNDKAALAYDLAVIRSMMSAGRNRIAIDGKIIALWGVLISLGFTGLYVTPSAEIAATPTMVWGPIIAIGWALSFYLGHKNGRRTIGDNPILRGYSSVTFSMGISMLIVFVASIAGDVIDGRDFLLLTSALMGTMLFTISQLMQLSWLRYVAMGWWAVLAFFSFVPQITLTQLAFLPLVTFSLLAIPGFKLMADAHKANEDHE